jgi:hypothetical protein
MWSAVDVVPARVHKTRPKYGDLAYKLAGPFGSVCPKKACQGYAEPRHASSRAPDTFRRNRSGLTVERSSHALTERFQFACNGATL